MKSAVEKLKFKSVQLHQRNTVDGKLVFPFRCGLHYFGNVTEEYEYENVA